MKYGVTHRSTRGNCFVCLSSLSCTRSHRHLLNVCLCHSVREAQVQINFDHVTAVVVEQRRLSFSPYFVSLRTQPLCECTCVYVSMAEDRSGCAKLSVSSARPPGRRSDKAVTNNFKISTTGAPHVPYICTLLNNPFSRLYSLDNFIHVPTCTFTFSLRCPTKRGTNKIPISSHNNFPCLAQLLSSILVLFS